MKTFFLLNIEDFFLIKKHYFTWNICRLFFITIIFFIFIYLFYNISLNNISNYYYYLFNVCIVLYAFFFLPNSLIHEIFISCFYRVLNINILIFITFYVMIIFNYNNFTTQELFYFSKFVWTSLLLSIFIKNLLYMKIDKHNLINLFIILSFISFFSYISLLILFSFVYLGLDSIILKMNGESNESNNFNNNSNLNNNEPNNPKPNDNYSKLYSENKSNNESKKEKIWDHLKTNVNKKVELNKLNLELNKNTMYREEYYRELDKNYNINNNPVPYMNNYGKNLINLFPKLPKDIGIYITVLKLELDSLSIDRDITLMNYKTLVSNESSSFYDKNPNLLKQLEEEKKMLLYKYQELNKELAQKDKDLRYKFKLYKIPEDNLKIIKF